MVPFQLSVPDNGSMSSTGMSPQPFAHSLLMDRPQVSLRPDRVDSLSYLFTELATWLPSGRDPKLTMLSSTGLTANSSDQV